MPEAEPCQISFAFFEPTWSTLATRHDGEVGPYYTYHAFKDTDQWSDTYRLRRMTQFALRSTFLPVDCDMSTWSKIAQKACFIYERNRARLLGLELPKTLREREAEVRAARNQPQWPINWGSSATANTNRLPTNWGSN